jgi:hypothetical protein
MTLKERYGSLFKIELVPATGQMDPNFCPSYEFGLSDGVYESGFTRFQGTPPLQKRTFALEN